VDREYEQAILRFTGASFAVGQNEKSTIAIN
jgi:hypothetical protein